MSRMGVHHLGLSTLDIDRTIDFYTNILGWKVAWCDVLEPPEGGRIKHAFMDTGDGTLVAFMCPEKVPGIPQEFKTDISSAQHLPQAFYHFAFEAGSEAGLEQKRQELMGKGIKVTEVVDHDWAKSIYFNDPNGVMLEYCCLTREFNADDGVMQPRFEMSLRAESPITDFRDR